MLCFAFCVFGFYSILCFVFVLIFGTLQLNSDFDDYHDSPKGEVNRNSLVNHNDVSDIFKDFVNDKGVSLCLKSLWKTRLCKFLHI